jgi:hypothetical protein
MLRRRLAFFVTCGSLCATSSCAAILGFEPLSEEGPPDARIDAAPSEASSDAADAGPNTACSELGLPDRPDAAAGGSVPPLLAALRLLDFGIEGESDGGRPTIPGLNLDLTCSTDLATSSCKLDLLGPGFDKHAKDKSATGIDNAGYGLIQFIGGFSDTFNAEGFNRGISEGRYGAVVRISRWNGQPDDEDVLLELFPAIGFQPHADGGRLPNFDEDDVWRLDKRFQLGGAVEGSRIVSDTGWVTSGRLVARFGAVTLPLMIADDPKPFDIYIRDAVISGTISTNPPLSDGIIAGRWKTSDFLSELKKIYILESLDIKDTLVCEPRGALLYTSVKEQLCDGRDLRSDSKDNQALPCDAVSTGARIETYRLKSLGKFVDSVDAGPRCETGSVIPADDDCK